jgi:pyruvate dehydrogenase E1 component beta subunit
MEGPERLISYAEALREGIALEMRRDPRVLLLGEDVGIFGGPFGVTTGLQTEFGGERVRDTPISEAGFFGLAVGAAMAGMRPIVEVHYSDFLTTAMDPIVNSAAKMRFMSGGTWGVPMVIRAPTGSSNRGPTHGQSLEAWFMNVPGLKVVCPATPFDAKGLLIQAIRDDDPVIFFEHRRLYGSRSPGGTMTSEWGQTRSLETHVPEEAYTISFGQAAIRRQGTDVTVVATLAMVHAALRVADVLAGDGVSIEVIDPRTLVPLDKETILNSVAKTNRLIIVTEGPKTGGVSAELAAMVVEEGFDLLDAPILRVTSLDTPVPLAAVAEEYVLPAEADIRLAIKDVLDLADPTEAS